MPLTGAAKDLVEYRLMAALRPTLEGHDVKWLRRAEGDKPITWLMAACILGDVAAVRSLVTDCGHNVNQRTQGMGVTALIVAASEGQADCLKSLIELGGEVTLKDGYGRGPAQRAAKNGHTACMALLKDNGCHMDTFDLFGVTPSDWAVLQRYGAAAPETSHQPVPWWHP
jgi:ankyrin repeat protein